MVGTTLVLGRAETPSPGHFFGRWRTFHMALVLLGVWTVAGAGCASRSRPALFRFALATLLAGCAWLLLELCGLLGAPYARVLGTRPGPALGSRAVPNLDFQGTSVQDIAARWNLPQEPLPVHYRTDRRGYRNQRDRNAGAVYTLGDSFLVAGLTPPEQFLPTVLETRLERPVVNLALIGLSLQEERDQFLAAHLPQQGRLVLHFVFEGNDLQDSKRYRTQQRNDAGPPLKYRSLAYNLILAGQRWTSPGLQAREATTRSALFAGQPVYFFWTGPYPDQELQPALGTLSDLRQEIQQAGGTYAVVFLPSKLRVLGPYSRFPADSELSDWSSHLPPLREALLSWGQAHHVPVLDLTGPLRKLAASGVLPWFPADTHWNGAGQRAAAAAIEAWQPVRNLLARLGR